MSEIRPDSYLRFSNVVISWNVLRASAEVGIYNLRDLYTCSLESSFDSSSSESNALLKPLQLTF